MEHNELKPCPFCGGTAVIDHEKICAGHGDFYTRFQIRCRKCRKRGKVVYDYDEDALRKEIERWNTSVKTDIKTVEKCELNREQIIKAFEVEGHNENRCVCCGDIIPEGRMICPICERESNPQKTIKSVKDIDLKKQKPELLAAQLRMIANSQSSIYCRAVLIEAASRLEDTNKIAKFFRNKVVAIMEGECEET